MKSRSILRQLGHKIRRFPTPSHERVDLIGKISFVTKWYHLTKGADFVKGKILLSLSTGVRMKPQQISKSLDRDDRPGSTRANDSDARSMRAPDGSMKAVLKVTMPADLPVRLKWTVTLSLLRMEDPEISSGKSSIIRQPFSPCSHQNLTKKYFEIKSIL
jgi:hypothetical protein